MAFYETPARKPYSPPLPPQPFLTTQLLIEAKKREAYARQVAAAPATRIETCPPDYS